MITNQLKGNIILGWLSGLSFRSAFVSSINSLILSGVPLISFHFPEVSLVPRGILKNSKSIFCLPLTAKICTGVKVDLKPHYLLFRDFTFSCVQLPKNIAKCFLKKSFLELILESICFICIT